MSKHSKEFIHQHDLVLALREKLEVEIAQLQKLCPHMHLDGSTAFPRGMSFVDCSLCGMSSYHAGLPAHS